ncbi:hypothetical protein [Methylovulum sp.]|uniref:hypothetical protein n=1 Tax=Methylovulum sp. TaxID=1916980 RepID=UPI0026250586|nr:hypothetical protein [Methylovulum sp.]MDD5126318.1 hypothetical protein [Methylovulum sp.]
MKKQLIFLQPATNPFSTPNNLVKKPDAPTRHDGESGTYCQIPTPTERHNQHITQTKKHNT